MMTSQIAIVKKENYDKDNCRPLLWGQLPVIFMITMMQINYIHNNNDNGFGNDNSHMTELK